MLHKWQKLRENGWASGRGSRERGRDKCPGSFFIVAVREKGEAAFLVTDSDEVVGQFLGGVRLGQGYGHRGVVAQRRDADLDNLGGLSRLSRVTVLCDEDGLLGLDHDDAVRLFAKTRAGGGGQSLSRREFSRKGRTRTDALLAVHAPVVGPDAEELLTGGLDSVGLDLARVVVHFGERRLLLGRERVPGTRGPDAALLAEDGGAADLARPEQVRVDVGYSPAGLRRRRIDDDDERTRRVRGQLTVRPSMERWTDLARTCFL